MTVRELALRAREASSSLRLASSGTKNKALGYLMELLDKNREEIIAQNALDIPLAREAGLSEALIDRLTLNDKRIDGMITGIGKVIALTDPIGSDDSGFRHTNGMNITRRRVPLGLIGIIYESRPNVTIDAAVLCIKSGNACLLRGGKEALRSNLCLSNLTREALSRAGLEPDCVSFVNDPSRESANEMMVLSGILDALIPRGGAGLIRAVVENARVPVIETGVGNCHMYIDSDSDLDMALKLAVNAKCSRPSVCNAIETLLVSRDIAKPFLSSLLPELEKHNVVLHGCPETEQILSGKVIPAAEDDWYCEYLNYELAIRIVGGMYEATAHIAKYGSGHSECIVTQNYFTARRFCERVDAAAVYVNASTRFTDGEEFGMGAEIGISTQKLHARGPLGLRELTTVKYIIEGDGQIRI